MSASAKTQALVKDASDVGCSGTAFHEILELCVVENAHARLAWTVRLPVHGEVLQPLCFGTRKDLLRTSNLNQHFPRTSVVMEGL